MGYRTLEFGGPENRELDSDRAASVRWLSIKSRKPEPHNGYCYYFSLSEKCFANENEASQYNVQLQHPDYSGLTGPELLRAPIRAEKNYELSSVEGRCVYLTWCAAKFATYGEQPRVHKLFTSYIRTKRSLEKAEH